VDITLIRLTIFAFLVNTGAGMILPILPLYVRELGGTGLLVGLVFSGVSLTRTLVSPPLGYLSDRYGRRKPFLLLGTFLLGLSGMVMAAAGKVATLFAGRIFQGMGVGVFSPNTFAYGTQRARKQSVGQSLSLLNLGFFLGFGVGPALGGWLAMRSGLQTPFVVYTALSLLTLMLIWWFLPPDRGIRKEGHLIPPFRSILYTLFHDPWVLALFYLRVALAFGRGVLMSLFPLLAVSRGLSASQIGFLLTLQLLLMTFLQPPMGWVLDRSGRARHRWMYLGNLLVNLGLLGFLFARSFQTFFWASLVTGIGGGLSIPAALVLIAQRGRLHGMGMTMSLLEAAFTGGYALGPLVGGLVYDGWGIHASFWLALVVGVTGLVVMITLMEYAYRVLPVEWD
jgi:DHA1 family multidrug resistance protein-like MFS transporter